MASRDQLPVAALTVTERVPAPGDSRVIIVATVAGDSITLTNFLSPRAPCDLYVLSPDTVPRRLTAGGENHAPAWSPNGNQIAFVHNGSVRIVTLTTGEVRSVAALAARLPEHPVMEYDYLVWETPRWSPNGNLLAAAGTNGGTKWVVVADVHAGRQQFRSPEEGYLYRWEPDGSLAYGPDESAMVRVRFDGK